jgi:hypothetical protein
MGWKALQRLPKSPLDSIKFHLELDSTPLPCYRQEKIEEKAKKKRQGCGKLSLLCRGRR